MINKLPLAEKTNIKNWAFEDLVLKDVLAPTLCELDIHTTPNQIIIVDGEIIHGNMPYGLQVEIEKFPVTATNSLLELNHQNVNSKINILVEKDEIATEVLSIVVIAKNRSLVHQTSIELQEGAMLEVMENYIGMGEFNANIIANYNVGANAKLKLSTINNMAANTVVYHHKHADVANDGMIDTTNFIINDTDLVFEDFAYLTGRGADADLKTVAIASDKQQQNLTIRTENIASNTVGNIVNYGIVKDEAHLAFNGVGKIQKASKSSDNQQETRLLNLSTTAEAVANPFLLIDEGDITAGHAASIGQLDEEQIYYLMSRGMSRAAASKMIVSGFLTPFVDAIQDEEMRATLAGKIEQKLG